MRRKVESAGVGVGNQGLGQVWSPRCPRRVDAGEREEDEAAQDHRDDSADDHDESLVNAENHPICMSARLDLKVRSSGLVRSPLAEWSHCPEARHGYQSSGRQEDPYVENGLGLRPAKLVHAQGGPQTGETD